MLKIHRDSNDQDSTVFAGSHGARSSSVGAYPFCLWRWRGPRFQLEQFFQQFFQLIEQLVQLIQLIQLVEQFLKHLVEQQFQLLRCGLHLLPGVDHQ